LIKELTALSYYEIKELFKFGSHKSVWHALKKKLDVKEDKRAYFKTLNYVECRKCRDVIVSLHRHDMVWCSCGAIAIDGGEDYTKLTGNKEDFLDPTEELEG